MIILKSKPVIWIGLVTTLLSIFACSPPITTSQQEIAQASSTPTVSKPIVLGDISNNPQKKIRKFQPLANYLTANLSEFDHGTVKIAPDMETMIAWLKSGKVDIYIDSPYPAMLAVDGADAKPILRRWKKGSAEYHTIIFTMSDRPIKSLTDLKGKMVAFDHPASTTGYMLPLATFLESGLKPVNKSSANAVVDTDEVGYVFSDEDENSIEWLLSKKVAAAAIDNIAFAQISAEIKEKAIVLSETAKVPRNIVLVSKDLPPEQIQAISSVLLAMDKTTEGKAVLEKFNRTTKFDDFPTTESLEKIQAVYQKAQNQ